MAFVGVSGVMSSNPISETDISFEATPFVDAEQDEVYTDRPISYGRRLRRTFWHFAARQFTLLCVVAVTIAGWLGRRRRKLLAGQGCEIMLTGRFDSDNWILAHLGPLAASKECARVWMVSTNPVPDIPKVVAICPPKWLIKIMGVTPSRLLTFLWAAMSKRPHFVGGFHIMVNGIVTAITGSLTGARSMYFCVGGPAEISGGGIHSADSYFTKMETSDTKVEKRLLQIVSKLDTIITMGTSAVKYFHNKGIRTDFHVLSGGIDTTRFMPSEKTPLYDLILTGRIVEVKRIDVFLQAVKLVADKIPEVKVLIVGEGKLLTELKQMSCDLKINNNVHFAGHQKDVENWLQKSKIFVLTSDSEGLSLSMMEAMMCGLPAVVSNVGDLSDLVEDGINGYLIPRRRPEKFTARIVELLTDEKKLSAFSKAARHSAMKYSTQAATEKWNHIITSYRPC
jgi:hypothetical protein